MAAHATVNHDYAVASDRFGGSYAYPTASALAAAGGFSQHFAHMRTYWNSQLAGIAQIQTLPDQSLIDASQYYSTAYNAGYGEWGLAGSNYRDQGILSYQFMISNGQSGPYSWWESQQLPNPGSPWAGTHPEAGNGSSPHAWGMANANPVLLDSLAAQRSDGSLVVGRGVPSSWVTSGKIIALVNFPAAGGRHLGLTVRTSGSSVTLTLSGAEQAGPVLFQLPAFVGNISRASAGTVDEKTVTVAATVRSVTVQLTHPAA